VMPTIAMHHVIRVGLGQPRFGALSIIGKRSGKGKGTESGQ
jgi:hypothetical protein